MIVHPSTYGPQDADPFAPVDLRERDRIELDEMARWQIKPAAAAKIREWFAEYGIERRS